MLSKGVLRRKAERQVAIGNTRGGQVGFASDADKAKRSSLATSSQSWKEKEEAKEETETQKGSSHSIDK